MNLRGLRDRLRRYPKPDDDAGVRKMVAGQWRTIAQRTPTYLRGYRDRPGSKDRAQRRAEWIAIMATGKDLHDPICCVYLELGCGAGRNLAAMQRWDMHAYGFIGIDVCLEAIVEARFAVVDADLRCANILSLRTLPKADIILTCGFLGHVPPADLIPLLRKMLTAAQRRIIMVEEPGHGELAKGPRAWGAAKSTGSYALWLHDYDMPFKALGWAVKRTPLPEDLRAPAATEMLVVERA